MTLDRFRGAPGPQVLIVGAGITGLLIAQGLKKAGISYAIFDAETPSISQPGEWTLAIVQWSIPILKKLLPIGLFDRLAEVQCDPTLEIGPDETVEFWNSQTGEVLKVIPTPNMKQVSRKKLRSLCAEGVEVLWGKRLDHVTYDLDGRGLKAHFADGSTYRGEMLVGADGPTSKVREILLGAERSRRAPPVDIVYNMAIVKYGDAMKAKHVRPGNGQVLFGYNPKGIFSMIAIQEVPDPSRPDTWTFQLNISWLGQQDASLSNAERIERVKRVARNLEEPFRSANLWIPDDTTIHDDEMSYWAPLPFEHHQGRITLCGDAAHPLPPHPGKGFNNCILDAWKFTETIMAMQSKRGRKDELITKYTDDMLSRGAEEVKSSLRTALTAHDWELLLESPLMKHGSVETN